MKRLFPILVLVASLSRCDTPAPPGETQNTSKIADFKDGDHCVLRTGNENIIVSRTKDELDKIIKMAVTKDNEGITLEAAEGRAFLVKAETKIIVLTTSYTVSEIRIEVAI